MFQVKESIPKTAQLFPQSQQEQGQEVRDLCDSAVNAGFHITLNLFLIYFTKHQTSHKLYNLL